MKRLHLLILALALVSVAAVVQQFPVYQTSNGVLMSSLVVGNNTSITTSGNGTISGASATTVSLASAGVGKLSLATTSNLTANRTLTFVPSDANRTIDLTSGNLTLSALATLTGAETLTNKTLTTPNLNGAVAIGYNLNVYGTGTAYHFTNATASITLGTISPALVIDKAGTYLVSGRVHVTYNGATITNQTLALKLNRTNNTPADLTSAAVTIGLPASTALTNSYGVVPLPPVIYTTAGTTDNIVLSGALSANAGAGNIDATAAGTDIVAIRLY